MEKADLSPPACLTHSRSKVKLDGSSNLLEFSAGFSHQSVFDRRSILKVLL
jgi:hypothetical protein